MRDVTAWIMEVTGDVEKDLRKANGKAWRDGRLLPRTDQIQESEKMMLRGKGGSILFRAFV